MDNPYVRLTRELNHGRLRAIIRRNEDRLDRYLKAATRWGAGWTRVSREMAGLPLAEAHGIMAARAAEHLPREP